MRKKINGTRLNKSFTYARTVGGMANEASTFALFIAFIFGAMSLVVIALYSEIRE